MAMSSVKFPYEIKAFEKDGQFKQDIPGLLDYVQVGPEKWLLPSRYAEYAETIYNFEARSDDVFICTFPRSGTTWTQEMIWLICNKLDYETAESIKLNDRFPFLELHTINKAHEAPYEKLAAQTTPRFIKTHLSLKLMPRTVEHIVARVVYVARNPKDVAVSLYNFCNANPRFSSVGSFDTFAQNFMENLTCFSPYWKHVLEGWSHRNDANFYFVFYEDLQFDLKNSLRKLSEFLGNPLKEDDFPKLMDHLQFDTFKKNSSINYKFDPNHSSGEEFVRRGKVGGNPEMTEEISKKFDGWTKQNLADSDLKFPC